MIKKIITYLLSLLMIFAPAYNAYALALPSKGQIIAIGKKGGAMIKTSGGRIVKGGAIGIGIEGARIGIGAAMSWCKNNQKKCKDKIGDIAELACDDFECIAEKEDEEQTDPECIDKEYYIRYNKGQMIYGADPDTVCQSYFNTLHYNKSIYTAYANDQGSMCVIKGDGTPIGQPNFTGNTLAVINKNTECTDKPKKRPLTDDELGELAKKIGESMDDDDIINYYNTDYGDIIINDKRYGGDDINYETNIDNRCTNNSCHEISQEIEQDVRSKKYDIDDVNEQNCTMSNNKYISCKKPDGDNDDTNDDTKQDEQDKQDEPLTCDSSKFHRKVCDWIDWTQDDLDAQDDGKAEIKDLSKDLELDDDKIKFGRACPSGPVVNISFAGVAVSHDISYEGLCGSFEKMRPFVIGIGGIVSVMIIGGRRA